MYKILKALKDTYITDRVVRGSRTHAANVGGAGTLDLFKLYGASYTQSGSTFTPNAELSRLLVKFDLTSLTDLISAGRINTADSSFSCTLKLYDVYGGQTTPRNFTVVAHPLSMSFDEGIGNDIIHYGDRAVCNFMTASWNSESDTPVVWHMSGANAGGAAGDANIDYITAIGAVSTESSQFFTTGEENLSLDVTNAIKSIVAGEISDHGFRIALSSSHENDSRSYFVKRFVARNAYDATLHPQLIVKYDDSLLSDQGNLSADVSGSLFLYNSSQGVLTDVVSGSTTLTGSNCLLLNLSTEISGGWSTYSFNGSKVSRGVYSASVVLPSADGVIAAKMAQSGTVVFRQIWTTMDGTLALMTGSLVTLNPVSRSNDPTVYTRYNVTTSGLLSEHTTVETVRLRVHIVDIQNQFVKLVKTPIESPGLVIRDVHYSVRDFQNDQVVIPFDKTNKSTRMSSDSRGMYVDVDMSNLVSGRTYVIDVLITRDGVDQMFRSASPVFRVIETM